MLKLVDVLAIKSPERERLVEADDAIRDLVRLLEAATEPEGRWPSVMHRPRRGGFGGRRAWR
jgi:hypothetical protein